MTLWILVYDLYRYGWVGWRQFITPAAWLVQLAVLAGLTLLFFASLGLRPAPKTAVAVLCLSLTAVLYGAELGLAGSARDGATMPLWGIGGSRKQEIASFVRGFGVTVDARDSLELLTDMRKRGIEAVQAVMLGEILAGGIVRTSESITDEGLLPLGGISGTVTVLCNEAGQYVTYQSDEHGFRNPIGIWSSAHADMAAVGESFTQGHCVPDGEGFVDLLRRQFSVTLNLGMSGQSALLQLAAIKEYLPRYAPKVVLWVFCEGIDVPDAYEESMYPLSTRYLDPTFSQRLLTRQPEIDNALRRFGSSKEMRARETTPTVRGDSFVERSLGIITLSNLRQRLDLVYGVKSGAGARTSSIMERRAYDLLSDTLARAQTVTGSWGGTLYFVYLPSWSRYRNGPRVSERERTRVLQLVNALGIPIIDIEPAFQSHHDPLALFPFRRFGHYNEAGNRIVAETVLRFLSAREQGNLRRAIE
jgi:hypothetical protein